jgi:hypothetical protein
MSDYSLSYASENDNVYSQTSIDDDDYDPDATTDDEQSTTNTKTPRRFSKNSKHPKRFCFRCGRTGHFVGSCYAKTRPDGTRLPRGRLSDSNPSPAKKQRPSPGIYVLQDPTGCIYVGKSNDRAARIRQHRAGQGTSFLTGELTELPPYTSGSINDLETWERNETLSAMYLKGIDQVRGWIFTSNTLTPIEKRHAFQQVCEKFDLCRKCGRHTHFANECRSKTVAYWAE